MTSVGPVVRRKADQGREWEDGVEPESMTCAAERRDRRPRCLDSKMVVFEDHRQQCVRPG